MRNKESWFKALLQDYHPGLLTKSLRRAVHWGSLGYAMGMRGRRAAYAHGWLSVKRLPRPTICVGNITVGGTGKTPIVVRLVSDLLDRGLRPAVLLRGYKREKKVRHPVLVRDARAIRASFAESGDEAMELAQRLPGACVGVGAHRFAVGQDILKHHPVDCFVMDDGFQHYQLDRDINIVAIDATDPWGGGKLLPAGLLREGPEALRRADLVVLTRAGHIAPDRLSILKAEVTSFMRETSPMLESRHQPQMLLSAGEQQSIPLERLKGRKVLAMSGIGRPETFEATLIHLGAHVAQTFRQSDHGGTAWEAWSWLNRTRQSGEWAIMTEKDAMRWLSDTHWPRPRDLYILRMDLVLTTHVESWEEMLHRIERLAPHAS